MSSKNEIKFLSKTELNDDIWNSAQGKIQFHMIKSIAKMFLLLIV